MCGIMGYMGHRDPKEVILSGLKSLEYRGYDSAGVAIYHQGEFKRIRSEGKIQHLENKLINEKFSGPTGIGHTRWATHGPPTERNAHPHAVGGIQIVHNGIIENYAEIKKMLASEGCLFASDTDSELVAHLLAKAYKKNPHLMEAVIEVIPQLRGAYSILAVSSEQPDEIVAFKNGPPLVVGWVNDSSKKSDQEVIIASDVQAILPYTHEVLYLQDQQILKVFKNQIFLHNLRGESLPFQLVHVEWDAEQTQKSGYSHFMLKEINEQPRVVAQAIEPHLCRESGRIRLQNLGWTGEKTDELLRNIEKIMIVACGTSYYAGMLAKYWFEHLSHIPTEVDIASEFRYRHPLLSPRTLLVVISQSGETADTLAALRLGKEKGAQVLSLCNTRGSSIDREAQGHLYMNAGLEIGVASTKAFVATIALLQILALALAQERKSQVLSEKDLDDCIQALLAAPSLMEQVLSYGDYFREVAGTLNKYKGFLYLGRGVQFPLALEGALKMKELAYRHAEGYAAGEMKHGPLALIDEEMAVVVLAPRDEWYEKTLSNLEEARARGGVIISLGSGEDTKLKELSRHYIALPQTHDFILPLLMALPLQLLAFHVAHSLGHDVDQPRHLAKSVTVE